MQANTFVKTIEFNNEYISKLGVDNDSFDVQILKSIFFEVEKNCEGIGYSHRNPLLGQVQYQTLFTKLHAAKLLLDNDLRDTDLKEVKFEYWDADLGGFRIKTIWRREN